MGAIQGTLTYRIYYTKGKMPKDINHAFMDAINEHAFQPLTPQDEEDVHHGWTVIDEPLNTDFNVSNVFRNQFLNLSFREDKYVIPSKLLAAHVSRAEQDYMVEHKKQKLTKFEKDDIKDIVMQEMKQQLIPRMSVTDMSWDTSQGRVRFWSQSARVCEIFMGVFYDTFGLEVIPAGAYNTAVQAGFSMEDITKLTGSQITQFANGIPGVDF